MWFTVMIMCILDNCFLFTVDVQYSPSVLEMGIADVRLLGAKKEIGFYGLWCAWERMCKGIGSVIIIGV